jgi:hypothetical protein
VRPHCGVGASWRRSPSGVDSGRGRSRCQVRLRVASHRRDVWPRRGRGGGLGAFHQPPPQCQQPRTRRPGRGGQAGLPSAAGDRGSAGRGRTTRGSRRGKNLPRVQPVSRGQGDVDSSQVDGGRGG